MAPRQLDMLTSGGKVIPVSLQAEMQRSYLEYAMSVIVGRALPDARDGLKPVHRRILYAMLELGLRPDRPYRKCARVVGDVLGKYHPHGDKAVYDALVRLVQDFSCRYPLIDGHGNFGSIDDDPAAAMRYTECRLAAIAQEGLLADLGEHAVDFGDNFDGSQREPLVLPARLPFLLLDGATGIAVGMATNIPPHNLGEVVEAAIALIDRPELDSAALQQWILGPDFPTGGLLLDDGSFAETYRTGRGSFGVRGVAHVETLGQGKRARPAIVITELPFQVNKAAFIARIAELVEKNKLEGIADLRDESDRTGMRVVIELRRDVNPEPLLQQLYQNTPLQDNFSAVFLALVGSQPKQLGLRELLQEFLQFREATLIRQYQHQRQTVGDRLALVAGLQTVLADIPGVMALLQQAADSAIAKQRLQAAYGLTPAQSEAVMAMPLRRLTALEQQELAKERETLTQQQNHLDKLLGDRRELLKALKKELRALKKQFGDERRTRIVPATMTTAAVPAIAVPPTPTVVHWLHKGYVKRMDGEDTAPWLTPDDGTITAIATQSDRSLWVFCDTGRVFGVGLQALPTGKRSRGIPLVTLLPEGAGQPIALLPTEDTLPLVGVTRRGRAKRIDGTEFGKLTARGNTAMGLDEGDRLLWVGVWPETTDGLIGTTAGRVLRLPGTEIGHAGRTAKGDRLLRLRGEETIAAVAPVSTATEMVLVTVQGYLKRLEIAKVRLAPRGSLGTQAIRLKTGDALLALHPIEPTATTLVLWVGDRQQRHTLTVPLTVLPRQTAGGESFSPHFRELIPVDLTARETVLGAHLYETVLLDSPKK
ncbi:MAG: DNA topoisomerase (ATP-hydrolyzing) [Pseudanabaenaceae cyanobacterium]